MNKIVILLAVFMLTIGSSFVLADNPDVSLIFECWSDNDDGTYTAYFGYENREGADVEVESSLSGNVISNTAIPGTFTYPATPSYVSETRQGRTQFYNVDGTNAFSATWDGTGNLVWSGAGKTATASLGGSECTYQPPVDEVPEFGLIAGAAVIALAGLFIYKKRSN